MQATANYLEVLTVFVIVCINILRVIRCKGAKIQLLDLPGIIKGAKDGKRHGRQVIVVE